MLRQKVENIDRITLSVHCHDDLGQLEKASELVKQMVEKTALGW